MDLPFRADCADILLGRQEQDADSWALGYLN